LTECCGEQGDPNATINDKTLYSSKFYTPNNYMSSRGFPIFDSRM